MKNLKVSVNHMVKKAKERIDEITAKEAIPLLEDDDVIIVDIRDKCSSSIIDQVESLGIKILWKHTVVETEGYKRIKSIEIMKLSDNGETVVGNKIKEKERRIKPGMEQQSCPRRTQFLYHTEF